MVTFLTSSFVPFQTMEEYVPKPLMEDYDFANNLRKYWPESAHILAFASNPSDAMHNDHLKKELYHCFTLANFPVAEIRVMDNRTIEAYAKANSISIQEAANSALREALTWADVFFLAGGHAPTQNAFMKRCGLKELLTEERVFDGVFIGLSAGSVNAATNVYLIPEMDGEALDPSFVRYTDGLGLTELQIIPHIQYCRTVTIDGMRMVEDVLASDSQKNPFYMITDGSYFMIRNGVTEFFGEGEIIERGMIRPLTPGIVAADHEVFRLGNHLSGREVDRFFDSFSSNYYDCMFLMDMRSQRIIFYHVSQKLLDYGIVPIHIDHFTEFNELFSKVLVVKDEKQEFLQQILPDVVENEIATKGSYVRTVHIDTKSGVNSESVRIDRYVGSENIYQGTITDITMVLDHDWMTDEYSRSGFLAKLEKMLRDPKYHKGYSVVYSNIKGFKAVNDLMGTFSGDMVIFSERTLLVDTFEPELIARLESDHFAMVVANDKLTKKNLKKLRLYAYQGKSKKMPLSLQCGIYEIKDPTKTALHMLDRAKLTENSISKHHGEVYAFYNETLTKNYLEQSRFIADMDKALKRKEFKAYFQPVVDAKTGEIVSAEALIRWIRPDEGMISPGRFIPIFEKEGMISKLDLFMVNQVIEMNQRRMEHNQRVVPCAVNLSRVDFYDRKLLSEIKHLSKVEESISELIEFEVTESAYEVLENDAMHFLRDMKEKNISLLLDDFGSGMSSLAALKNFEYDIIKLDMGFVSQIGKSTKTEAILRHSIGLFHDLGAKVVAEGVESENQLAFLREAGCDYIQGYYFYKPLPMEEFENLL